MFRSRIRAVVSLLSGCLGHLPRLSRLWRDRKSAVAIMVALMAPGLIGVSALAVEVSDWYATHQALQIAADAGALAAARLGSTKTALLDTVAADAANAATGHAFNFSSASGTIAVSAKTVSKGISVSVTTKGKPQQIIASVIGPALPVLSAQAGATLQATPPPPTATCYSNNSYTYVVPTGKGVAYAHVAGIDPVQCGNNSLIQPLVYYGRGTEGQLVDQPVELTNNNNTPPSSGLASNVPSTVPDCNNDYNPQQPTTDASNPTSTTDNGMTVYFGTVTGTSQSSSSQGGTATIYSFSPIIVGPGSSFCDVNDVCTIPAGAYCGGLQINPGVTLNFVASGGNNAFEILDGNLLMATSDPFGVTNDPNAKFFFGGAQIGSLILDTQTSIYAGSTTTGTVVFKSSMIANWTNGNGSKLIDQVCPLGVLPIGVTSSGAPICPTEVTATSGGQTTTTLDTSNTVTGTTSSSYTVNTNQSFASYDTYTTTITFNNGVATSWQANESTLNGTVDSSGQFNQLNAQGLNYAGQLGSNATSAATSSAPASCAQSASNNLFYSSSSSSNPTLGLSSATQNGSNTAIGLTDTVSVCGTGNPLVASASGSELVVGSQTGTSVVYLTQ